MCCLMVGLCYQDFNVGGWGMGQGQPIKFCYESRQTVEFESSPIRLWRYCIVEMLTGENNTSSVLPLLMADILK